MARLDAQRRPSKAHVRSSNRKYARGYDTVPHEIWGDTITGGATYPATQALAGIPGTWLPEGSTRPATLAALQAGTPVTVSASPTAAWTTGQYVQTATAGAPGEACWTGGAWVGGKAP